MGRRRSRSPTTRADEKPDKKSRTHKRREPSSSSGSDSSPDRLRSSGKAEKKERRSSSKKLNPETAEAYPIQTRSKYYHSMSLMTQILSHFSNTLLIK